MRTAYPSSAPLVALVALLSSFHHHVVIITVQKHTSTTHARERQGCPCHGRQSWHWQGHGDVFLQRGAAKGYATVRNVQAAKEIFANNDDRVVILYLDLAKPESIQQAAKQSQDVDIVINNGGHSTRTL